MALFSVISRLIVCGWIFAFFVSHQVGGAQVCNERVGPAQVAEIFDDGFVVCEMGALRD
jgi:hypothetical protein